MRNEVFDEGLKAFLVIFLIFSVISGISFFIGYESGKTGNVQTTVHRLSSVVSQEPERDILEKIPSPKDRIKPEHIIVSKDKIIIDVEDASWSIYEPSGSMLPTLSSRANGLYITPDGPEDINIGDIISYKKDGENNIVHRVIDIKEDEFGNKEYVVKGDSNSVPDEEPVPYSKIDRVLIGIIY